MAAVSFPLIHPCLRSLSPHVATLFLPSTPLRRPPQHFKSLPRGSCRRLAAASSFPSSAVESDSRPAIEVSEGTSEVKKEEDLVEHRIVLPTNESSEKLLRIRHTCAHIMAMAVQRLFPGSKVTIGPWIDNGFYYDFDMEPLADRDLKRIKKEMGTEFIS